MQPLINVYWKKKILHWEKYGTCRIAIYFVLTAEMDKKRDVYMIVNIDILFPLRWLSIKVVCL